MDLRDAIALRLLPAAISQDDGQTWINERVIAGDPDDDYGDQKVTFVEDMAIVSYHTRDGLYVARIGIDWFYGKTRLFLR